MRCFKYIIVLVGAAVLAGSCSSSSSNTSLEVGSEIRRFVQVGPSSMAFSVIESGEEFSNQEVVLWEAGSDGPIVLGAHQHPVKNLSSNGKTLVTVDIEGELKIFDLASRSERATTEVPSGVRPDMLEMLDDGRLAGAAIGARQLAIWSPDSPEAVELVDVNLVLGLEASSNAVLVTDNYAVSRWDADSETLTEVAVAASSDAPLGRGLSAFADGSFATLSDAGEVRVWTSDSSTEPEMTYTSAGQVYTEFAEVVQLADGRLAAGGFNGVDFWQDSEPSKPEKTVGDGKLPGRVGLVQLGDGQLVTFFQTGFEILRP